MVDAAGAGTWRCLTASTAGTPPGWPLRRWCCGPLLKPSLLLRTVQGNPKVHSSLKRPHGPRDQTRPLGALRGYGDGLELYFLLDVLAFLQVTNVLHHLYISCTGFCSKFCCVVVTQGCALLVCPRAKGLSQLAGSGFSIAMHS